MPRLPDILRYVCGWMNVVLLNREAGMLYRWRGSAGWLRRRLVGVALLLSGVFVRRRPRRSL